MDAIHYDKIADKLVNFHSKLPQEVDLELDSSKERINNMRILIMTMLHEIDVLATIDQEGWIR